jgi:hypothetical protein
LATSLKRDLEMLERSKLKRYGMEL